MNWLSAPIGMIRHDELLNALLAIWKTQHGLTHKDDSTDFSQGYQIGFEEGLDAIAQMAGLTEAFEAGKAIHHARVKIKLNSKVEVIDSQAAFVDRHLLK